MFEVVIDKKTYLHPSRPEEVTLKQWIDLNGETEEINAFAAFSGIPLKELLSAPQKDVLAHINRLALLLKNIKEDTKSDAPGKIKLGKYNYYVNKDIGAASMAQYLDCTHYMKYFKDNITGFYPYMMAIYCLRKDEEYNGEGYDLEKRAEIMRGALAVDAIRINAFFLNGSTEYAHNFNLYFPESLPMSNY